MLGPDLDWALLIVPESTLYISDLVQFMAYTGLGWDSQLGSHLSFGGLKIWQQ